jgi:hypothetical protein
MVAPGPLDKVLPDPVHARRVAVHAAQEFALEDIGYDCGACMAVRRGEAVGLVRDFEADYGFAGGVGEFVVVEDFEGLARAFAKGGGVSGVGCWRGALTCPLGTGADAILTGI